MDTVKEINSHILYSEHDMQNVSRVLYLIKHILTQMNAFCMTLVLVKENKCEKFLLNPFINVEVVLWTKSVLTFEIQL